MFWSSVDLTGNQTIEHASSMASSFWSSVDLTGNQTNNAGSLNDYRFGAVSI